MLQKSSFAVDVNRRANVGGDFPNVYAFSKKPPVFVVEIVHVFVLSASGQSLRLACGFDKRS
jgi:hypothetical protein